MFHNNENGELISRAYFLIFSKISEFCKTSLVSRIEHSKSLRLSIKILVHNLVNLNIITAYFTKFPLLGKRGVDFFYWKESILKVEKKEYKGLSEIKPYNKWSNINYSDSFLNPKFFSLFINNEKNDASSIKSSFQQPMTELHLSSGLKSIFGIHSIRFSTTAVVYSDNQKLSMTERPATLVGTGRFEGYILEYLHKHPG